MTGLPYDNQVFYRPVFGDSVKVKNIQTHERGEVGKKVKLTRNVYTMGYSDESRPTFTTYLEEIERMIKFERWVPNG